MRSEECFSSSCIRSGAYKARCGCYPALKLMIEAVPVPEVRSFPTTTRGTVGLLSSCSCPARTLTNETC